nr:MAG TPA: hypothetical protein [Caudoviricetes sp.]
MLKLSRKKIRKGFDFRQKQVLRKYYESLLKVY